jgi:lysophospholipase
VPLPPGGAAWDAALALEACDGVRLRGALWRGGGRGLAVLLQGRTEFLEKLAIPAAALRARGFAVAALDWRGQGLSERRAEPPLKGHVGDFAEYERDLAALLAAPEVAAAGPVRLVLAHSMGAAVALGARASGRLAPGPLVLSAPMLGIAMPRAMRLAARATVCAARRLGRLDRWPPLGAVDRPYVLTARAEENVLTADRAVFAWMAGALRAEPRLAVAMPSLAWFAAAEARMAALRRMGPLEAPALCLLGTEEAVVDAGAVRAGAARLGARLVEIAGARHEPLVEAEPMRGRAWGAIDAFLADAGV